MRCQIAVLTIGLLVTSGCGGSSTGGNGGLNTCKTVTEAQLCEFRYHITTEAQVRAVLGAPSLETSFADGSNLQYQCSSGTDSPVSITSFSFDKDGLLSDVLLGSMGTTQPSPACLGTP